MAWRVNARKRPRRGSEVEVAAFRKAAGHRAKSTLARGDLNRSESVWAACLFVSASEKRGRQLVANFFFFISLIFDW